jgi:hypothetical protein
MHAMLPTAAYPTLSDGNYLVGRRRPIGFFLMQSTVGKMS